MENALHLAGAMVVALPTGPPTTAAAEMVNLHAELKGSNEVPAHASSGSGKVEATFDTFTKVLTYTVTYSDLSGPALDAHFDGLGDAGKNTGIALPFKWAQSPIQSSATLPDPQAADLLGGKLYANIHTANLGGELHREMAK